MKKAIFIFFLIACVVLGVFISQKIFATRSFDPRLPASLAIPTPQVAVPVRISIPALGIQAPIESVGLDSQNRIDVPKNILGTGWYSLGVKPGAPGSAVIDGHFDTPAGLPSVFYNIKKLKPGDSILITGENGKALRFTVEKVASYPLESIPMAKILEKTKESRLNLITCGGTWDSALHIYNERVVVFSILTE